MEAEPFVSTTAQEYLRLCLIRGIGPRTGRQLIEAFGSASRLWSASPARRDEVDGVTPRLSSLLADGQPLAEADATIALCRANGIHILTLEDDLYPRRLYACTDAPLVLFVRGDLKALNFPRMLAVIGARKASREGRLITRRWSRYLSERQVCIVSGMAYGIDAAAHGGALEGDGLTVAVLGCGLMQIGSETQLRQAEAISAQGCVISEYLPGQQARPEHFPQRNRIIAGLADGVLVMEADIRSGSLITAGQAAGYGRDVMAVPGSVLNGMHAGCHQLIRDGALLVESGEQVMQEMEWQGGTASDSEPFHAASENEARVYALLNEEIMHIDALAEGCNLTVSELSPILLALELRGVVERLPGSRYTLIRV